MLPSPDAEGRGCRKGEDVNEDQVMPHTDAQPSFEAWALRLQLLAELRALAGDEPDPAAGAPIVSP
jgi:hypothetical protein